MSQRRKAPVPPRFKNFEEVWQAFLELSRAMNANLEQGVYVDPVSRTPGDEVVIRSDGKDGALQGSKTTINDSGVMTITGDDQVGLVVAPVGTLGGPDARAYVDLQGVVHWRLVSEEQIAATSPFLIRDVTNAKIPFHISKNASSKYTQAAGFSFTLSDAGGAQKFSVLDSGLVEVFRVDSDGKARVLQGGAAFTFNAETGIGVQNNSGADKGAILSLIGGETTGNSQIAFGDKDNEFAGRLLYFHADNRFEFRVNGSATPVVTITSAGRLKLGSASGPDIITGTGTPEGVVTAVVGSLFLRTDGGAGTSFYVKESGSGNTGWAAK